MTSMTSVEVAVSELSNKKNEFKKQKSNVEKMAQSQMQRE